MKNKRIYRIKAMLMFVFTFIVTFVIGGVNWFQGNWDSSIDFATILYQLRTPLKGTDSGIIFSFCEEVLPYTFIVSIIVAGLYYTFTCIFSTLTFRMVLNVFDARKEIVFGQKFCKYGRIVIWLLFFAIATGQIVSKFFALGIDEYVYDLNNKTTLFEEYYVEPNTVSMNFPERKRNLLFIYLESMETTYASVEDGGGKPVNYIPELTQLAEEYVSFSNTNKIGGIFPSALTGWTMGALLGTTSGVPYKIPGGGNESENYDEFLPGLVTLGDILVENGYNNYFLCGSDAEFAGRKTYFEKHGDYEVMDYYYCLDHGIIPKDYKVYWGIEDATLFEIAKQQLTEIAAKEEPFNFTMLTVDTHTPDGFACEECENLYDSQYANAIACSSRHVYQFVRWAQEQAWYENTTIILLGDHNSMKQDFWDDINGFSRRTYNCFINIPESLKVDNIKNRAVASLDIFPTTLAALGVEILGNRLGLGVNAFSDEATLLEKFGKETYQAQLKGYSAYYDKYFIGSKAK